MRNVQSLTNLTNKIPRTVVASLALLALLLVLPGCQTAEQRWAKTEAIGTRQAYKDYLDGKCVEPHITTAGERLLQMYLDDILASDDPKQVAKLIRAIQAKDEPHRRVKYSKTKDFRKALLNQAYRKLYYLLYAKATEMNTVAGYIQFLKMYPKGPCTVKVKAALAAIRDNIKSQVRTYRLKTVDRSKPDAPRFDYADAIEKFLRSCSDLEPAPDTKTSDLEPAPDTKTSDLEPAPDTKTSDPVLDIGLSVEQIALGAQYVSSGTNWTTVAGKRVPAQYQRVAGFYYTGYDRKYALAATIGKAAIRAKRNGSDKKAPIGSFSVSTTGREAGGVILLGWKDPKRMYVKSLWPESGKSNSLQKDFFHAVLEAAGPTRFLDKLVLFCTRERLHPGKLIAEGVWPTRPLDKSWWKGLASDALVGLFNEGLPSSLAMKHVNATDWWVRKMVAWSLRSDKSPAATKVLLRMTEDENSSVRMAAVCALTDRESDDVTAVLVKRLTDSSSRVAEAAAITLRDRQWIPTTSAQRAVFALSLGEVPEVDHLDRDVVESIIYRLASGDWLTRKTVLDFARQMRGVSRQVLVDALTRASENADELTASHLNAAIGSLKTEPQMLSAADVEREYSRINDPESISVSIGVWVADRDDVRLNLLRQLNWRLRAKNPKAYLKIVVDEEESKSKRRIIPVVGVAIWDQWLLDAGQKARGVKPSATPLVYALGMAPNSRDAIIRILPKGVPTLSGQPTTKPTRREELFARRMIKSFGLDEQTGPEAGLILVVTPEYMESIQQEYNEVVGDILTEAAKLIGAHWASVRLSSYLSAPPAAYGFGKGILLRSGNPGPWLKAAAQGRTTHPWPSPASTSTVEGVVTYVASSKDGLEVTITSSANGVSKQHKVDRLLCTSLRKNDTVRVGDIVGIRQAAGQPGR